MLLVQVDITEQQLERERGRMLEGRGMVQDTDMPAKMQAQAMTAACRALDRFDVSDCRSIAACIKKEFDERYGPGWQCVVGSNFGCFFTHTHGTFIHFCLERLSFLVFKGTAPSAKPKNPNMQM